MLPMNGQPLRADPTQLTIGIVMVQLGNPTYIPNMVIAQGLHPYVRHITSMVQIEVESKAGQSPIRIHAHNLLAQNNFQNADFVELMDIVFGYINHLMTFTQQFGDIQNCINAVVPHVVGAWSAAQVRQYPDLMQYLNPQQQGVAQNAIATIQQIVADIMRSKQGQFPPQGGYQQQMQPQMQGPGWAQGPAPGFATQGFAPQTFNQPGFVMGQQPGVQIPQRAAPATAGLFVNSARPMVAVQDQMVNISTDHANKSAERMRLQLMEQHGITPETQTPAPSVSQPVGPAPAVTTHPDHPLKGQIFGQLQKMETESRFEKPRFDSIAETFIVTNEENLVKNKEEKLDAWKPPMTYRDWKRSIHQDYHPAWSPSTHKPLYKGLDDNTVICEIVEITESETGMDYDAHAIGIKPTQTATFKREGDKEVVKTNQTEIQKIEYPTTDIEFIENDSIMVDVSDRIPAVSAGLLGVMSGFITKKNQVFHTTTHIAEPIFAESEIVADYLTMIVGRASACQNFSQLHDVMSELTSLDEINLRERMNQILTRAINDVLMTSIGQKVYIDDFERDGKNLIADIKTKFKERIGGCIEEDQLRLIKATLNTADDVTKKSMNQNMKSFLVDEQDWKGCLAFITCRVTHTHLQYTAAELNIAFPRRDVALLSEEFTPVIFRVAVEIFEIASKSKIPTARHFIVTKDGLVLMVQRGLLNKESYLIKVVD